MARPRPVLGDLGGHADAGVAHRKADADAGRQRVERDGAGFGELQGVREQIVEHLPQTGRIAAIDAAHRLDLDPERQPLGLGEHGERAGGAVDH
jgi:hypothetical protein